MRWSCLLLMLVWLAGPAAGATATTPVMVQDFEDATSPARVWVAKLPAKDATVALTTEHPCAGQQCLKLHYHFTSEGQALGVVLPARIAAPIHQVRLQVYGDQAGCGYGLDLTDAAGRTHHYREPDTMVLKFAGWHEVTIDLEGPHETIGSDKWDRGKYPLKALTFVLYPPAGGGDALELETRGDLYLDDVVVMSDKGAEETVGGEIAVTAPAYGASIKGDTLIALAARGFAQVTAKCWQAGEGDGADATIATVDLDARGNGAFVFPADTFPHGPLTVRLSASRGSDTDTCYLQLYNAGGVAWHAGLPADPPAAAGLALVFADDFTQMPAISATDPKAPYYDHKPPNGTQDFSTLRFASFASPKNPFTQSDTYLRIRADEQLGSAGILSSLKNDGSGIKTPIPCYFECRFLAPNAIGTWPAFWLMTDYLSKPVAEGSDELDIVEQYGGDGPHEPNPGDSYMISPHCWDQGEVGHALQAVAYAAMKNPCRMRAVGVPATWYEAFHTYGCLVTATQTTYYCDNRAVGHHDTLPRCKDRPLFFMIDLATGGGWPVDLSRYDGRADMYVDFVRVYGPPPAAATPAP